MWFSPLLFFLSSFSLVLSDSPDVFIIYVGSDSANPEGPYQFTPAVVTPNIGDTLVFRWSSSGNHSVMLCTFEDPCRERLVPSSLTTGFIFKGPNSPTIPERNLTISSTDRESGNIKTWFRSHSGWCEIPPTPVYCCIHHSSHTQGVVFAVNPNGNETYEAFRAAAIARDSPTASTSGSSPQSAAVYPLAKNSKPPVAAIAGGVSGGVTFIGLVGLTFAYCRRRRLSQKPLDNMSEAERGPGPDPDSSNLLDTDGQPAGSDEVVLDVRPKSPSKPKKKTSLATVAGGVAQGASLAGEAVLSIHRKMFKKADVGFEAEETRVGMELGPSALQVALGGPSISQDSDRNSIQETSSMTKVNGPTAKSGGLSGDFIFKVRSKFLNKPKAESPEAQVTLDSTDLTVISPTPTSPQDDVDSNADGTAHLESTSIGPTSNRHTTVTVNLQSPADESSSNHDPTSSDEPADNEARPPPESQDSTPRQSSSQLHPDPSRPTRSLSTMKRDQTRAISRDQQHSATDVLIQTDAGLQLLPGHGRVVSTDESRAVASELRDLRAYIRVLEADLAAGRGEPVVPPPSYDG
ncbi:hypothetical protein B0H10DRAFT_1948302 [Mycena sp. CBHHK59/15]|nr:hypothetical protein B0H10DRAFT_1948302 [Mycena sp. CBHHK59/15]